MQHTIVLDHACSRAVTLRLQHLLVSIVSPSFPGLLRLTTQRQEGVLTKHLQAECVLSAAVQYALS